MRAASEVQPVVVHLTRGSADMQISDPMLNLEPMGSTLFYFEYRVSAQFDPFQWQSWYLQRNFPSEKGVSNYRSAIEDC